MARFLPTLALVVSCALALSACSRDEAPVVDPVDAAAATVTSIADRYYTETLKRTPEIAYFSGIEPDSHDRIANYQAAE